MDELTADHAAFRDTVTALREAADLLAEDRGRAERSVDALLAGWTGTVATAYAEGWDAWRDGAARVLAGLTTMTRLVEAVDTDLVATDAVAGAGLDRLTARLG